MKTIALLPLLLFGLGTPQEAPVLEVTISQVRSDKGRILVSVYSDPGQYPYKPFRTCPVSKDSLNDGRLTAVIHGLAPGTYVLGLLDDENGSGNMEYTRIGIPKEGFGFSNNQKPLFSKPDYEKLTFKVLPGLNRVVITVQYKLRQ
ncbi:MAG: DUF2141 domain-containing protein [Bacteroidales bacterium]